MKEPTQIEKLDAFLKVLQNDQGSILETEITKKIHPIILTNEEFLRCYEKLIADKYMVKYMDQRKSVIMYYCTFEGYLFHGYQRQKEIDDLTYTIALENENRTRSYERRLVRATWFAGIAAGLLLLWQIFWQVFLYFYPVHVNYPYFFWHK